MGRAAVLILTLAAASAEAAGQEPGVTLRLVPDSVVLPADRATATYVVAHNSGPSPVRDLEVSWLAGPGLTAQSSRDGVDRLIPRATFSSTLVIRGRVGAERDRVVVRVDYSDDDGVRHAAFAMLYVQAGPVEALEDLIEIELPTQLTGIRDRDSGVAHLVLRNRTAVPVTIGPVEVYGPAFIRFKPTDEVTLLPRRWEAIPLTYKTLDWVRPGRHMLAFQLPFRWEDPAGPMEGSRVLTREIDVAVLGESAILQLLAIPSFLVLPGFLIVVAFGMCARYVGGSRSLLARGFPPDSTKAEFWVLAITFSLLMAVAYPHLPLIGARSYLDGYGVSDVAKVWGVSLFIGAALFVAVVGADEARHYLSHKAHERRTPSSQDDPLTVLRKLAEQKLSVQRDQVQFRRDGQVERGFVLQQASANAINVWVSPSIAVRWDDHAPDEQVSRFDHLHEQGDPGKLADLLNESRGSVRVQWKPVGQLNRPQKTGDAELKWLEARSIIEKE